MANSVRIPTVKLSKVKYKGEREREKNVYAKLYEKVRKGNACE